MVFDTPMRAVHKPQISPKPNKPLNYRLSEKWVSLALAVTLKSEKNMASLTDTFNIGKNICAAGATIGLKLQGSDNIPAVAAILSGSAPFPSGTNEIVTINLKASTGATVPLGDPQGGTVAFTARGSGEFAMHIYPDAAAVKGGTGFSLSGGPGERFLILDLDYDAALTAKGSAALGGGATAVFSGSANRSRAWKVIHRFGDVPAFQSVTDTLQSWILPRQIDSVDRLSPGTWIVTEVDGSFSLNLGVQAGYDFSWLREVSGGLVKGDLGLKVQAASATLGFSAGGTCVLVVGRESDAPVLRVTLNKTAQEAREFNVAAGATAITKAKPGDLVAAILGIHPAQIVEDLRKVAPQFADFFALWDKLGPNPASTLLSLAAEHTPDVMRRFSAVLDEIAAVATNPLKVTTILEREIGNPEFFSTPLGVLLSSQTQGLVAALQDLNAVKRLADFAGTARDLLNCKLPPQLLAKLNKLPAYKDLDDWLKGKLADFIGKPVQKYTVADHDKVLKLSATLLSKAQSFLALAVEAARSHLEAKFAAACQSTTCDTALIDADFDFGVNPGLLPLFRKAIGGDFTSILTEAVPGVRLRKGVLTHGIERQVHSDLSLPFYSAKSYSLLASLAKITATGDNGRVLVYELNASDDWSSQVKARLARDSRLSMTATFAGQLPGVRNYGANQSSFGYSLTTGVRSLTTAQLERYLEPILTEYFPDRVNLAGNGLNGGGLIGDSRIALDVDVPAEALGEWFEAPLDREDPIYFKFSRLMQTRLKELICNVYFSDPTRYSTLGVAGPVLVWASIPPMNSFDGRHILWDASDRESFARVVGDLNTREALRRRCAQIQPLLASLPELRNTAKFYDVADPVIAPINLSNLLGSALRRPSLYLPMPVILAALVAFEQEVIRSAVNSAVEAARFRQDAAQKPAEAIRHLSKFGQDIVVTFHERLRDNLAIPADLLTPLGAGLYAEAARALRIARTGDDSGIRPHALFSLTVLKPGQNLTPEQLRQGQFAMDRIAAERRIAC